MTNKQLQELLAELPGELPVELGILLVADANAPRPDAKKLELHYSICGAAVSPDDEIVFIIHSPKDTDEYLAAAGKFVAFDTAPAKVH